MNILFLLIWNHCILRTEENFVLLTDLRYSCLWNPYPPPQPPPNLFYCTIPSSVKSRTPNMFQCFADTNPQPGVPWPLCLLKFSPPSRSWFISLTPPYYAWCWVEAYTSLYSSLGNEFLEGRIIYDFLLISLQCHEQTLSKYWIFWLMSFWPLNNT